MKCITILFDGEDVQITTTGFTGASCLKATAELERALGRVKKDTKTAEYQQVSHDASKRI